jgi:hypothetical protein
MRTVIVRRRESGESRDERAREPKSGGGDEEHLT